MKLSSTIAAIVLLMVLATWAFAGISGYDLVAQVDPELANQGPSASFWLGTDHMGRDVAWRIVLATRAFVGPGVLACLIALLAGVGAGAVAGWLGGAPAALLRWMSTVMASIPRFILVLLGAAIYGDSTWILGAIAGIAYSPTLAEAIYNRIDSLKDAEFVVASRAHGLSSARILLFHLLWVNCRRIMGRHALYLFGYLILLETTLSYIGGFGVKEPDPSWGNMLAFEFGQRDGNLWGVLAPAIAIWVTILASNILGDALAEQRHGN